MATIKVVPPTNIQDVIAYMREVNPNQVKSEKDAIKKVKKGKLD